MKDFNHPLSSREDTLRLLLEHSQFQPRVETIPVRASLGRITASEVTALNTLPNSPSSQMDGIAIKSANLGAGDMVEVEYAVAPGSMGIVEFTIPTNVIQSSLVSNTYIK